jgi:hypothetical protein
MKDKRTEDLKGTLLAAFITGFREGQDNSESIRDFIMARRGADPEFANAAKLVEQMTREQQEQLVEVWPTAVAFAHVAAYYMQSQLDGLAKVLQRIEPHLNLLDEVLRSRNQSESPS